MKSDSTAIVSALRCLFADNFVTYYKSHSFHFNVQGPTFAQDHELLNEVYDFLYEQHDLLGEQLRQLDKAAPASLKSILGISEITENAQAELSSKSMYENLVNDFECLIRNGQWLYTSADENNMGGLSTLIGDYLKGLSKLNWKLKATLSRSIK